MARYSLVTQSDPDADQTGENTGEPKSEHCENCGSSRRSRSSWSRKAQWNRNSWVLPIIVVLLIANLAFLMTIFARSGHHRESGGRHAQLVGIQEPEYKSSEAAKYWSQHKHGHAQQSKPEHEDEHAHDHVHDHSHDINKEHDVENSTPPAQSNTSVCDTPAIPATVNITDQDVARYTSVYTPALEAIQYLDGADMEYEYENDNTYRGPPTAEREKAWTDLYYHEGWFVPAEAMPYINRSDTDKYQKAGASHGDGYVAWSDMDQKLGCLSMIRAYTYFLGGAYTPDRVPGELRFPPQVNRKHIDHCIESLRLSIMCHGDMTPKLLRIDRNPAGWLNEFGSFQKCRNYTRLREWTLAHGAEDWDERQGHHLNITKF